VDRCWVVLRTQPRHELPAARAVQGQGVESYLPLLPPKRRPRPAAPLFPGSLFARVTPDSDDVLRIRSAYCARIAADLGETLGHLSIVVVEQAAQHVAPPDLAVPAGPVRGDRSTLLKTLVRARPVVVAHVGGEHPPQVGLAEDQQVVQAFLSP
jgi:hypothetical protein